MIIRPTRLLLSATVAAAVHHAPSPRDAPTAKTIFSLPSNTSWLENLAYRSSAPSILATRLDTPQLWSIDPSKGAGTVLANASGTDALIGITQTRYGPDEFWVAGANFSTSTGVLQPNSTSFWRLSFSSDGGDAGFTFEEAFGVPGIQLVNGLATWNETTVLAADSYLGAVWMIDTATGDASVVLQDASMASDGGVGVNGVKVARSGDEQTWIYYTSTEQSLLARIPVDPVTAAPRGAAEIIATYLGEADDFALLGDGGVVLATGSNNTVVRVGLDGDVVTVAGSVGSLELASATSCQFGSDEKTLYVTTAGGAEGAVNQTLEGPGSVVAIEFQ